MRLYQAFLFLFLPLPKNTIMIKAKTYLTIMCLLFAVTASFCQYFRLGKLDEVKEVQKRPVLLMLEEEDPKVMKKLAKEPAELSAYKEEIKRANEAMQDLVPKYWTLNATPVTKTKTEIDKMVEGKNKQYAVLALERTKVTDYTKNGAYRYEGASKVIANIYIDLVENLGKGNPVYYQNLPNVFPTKGDMVIGIEMMQNFLQARLAGKKRNEISDEADENKSLLPGKTLLIDKEDLKKGISEADIKVAYPFPFKVVDYSTIENAILNRDKSYAIVQIIPLTAGVQANAHIVLNAEDGKSMGYYAPIQATVMGKNNMGRITERHLKNYSK